MINPMNLIQALSTARDPAGFMLGMMQKNVPQTPMANNAMNIIASGNQKGAEQMVRNLCQSRGLDVNQVMAQAKRMFGAK